MPPQLPGWISSSSSEASEDVPIDADTERLSTPGLTSDSLDPHGSDDEGGAAFEDPVVVHARAYQLEMFEESMKQNVIVVVGFP